MGTGSGYTWHLPLTEPLYRTAVPLDDLIPWSVTLDPDGLSGNTNLAGATISGTFAPIPPTTAVQLYAPRMMHGFETYSLSYSNATVSNLGVLFGVPTTHGAQTVVSVSSPVGGQVTNTPPFGIPLCVVSRTNASAGVYQDTNYFTMQLNSICVNPAMLRTNTWADLAAMTTNWTQWLAPDAEAQSTNPLILAFVQQSLPSNYRAVLTPYDAARTLHRAVARQIVYQTPVPHIDALFALTNGYSDCGGYANLMVSCLRSIGIPARLKSAASGEGTNDGVHCPMWNSICPETSGGCWPIQPDPASWTRRAHTPIISVMFWMPIPIWRWTLANSTHPVLRQFFSYRSATPILAGEFRPITPILTAPTSNQTGSWP